MAPLLREVGVVGRRPGPPADGLRVTQGLTGKVHRPLIASGPPATWITVCGWQWAKGGFAGWFPVRLGTESCKRCFPAAC